MARKTYLMVTFVLIVSVFFGSMLYNSITVAQERREADKADATNGPLGGQEKVKTANGETSSIVLVFNQSLLIPSDLFSFIFLTSVNTSGFKYAYLMAKASGLWQEGANINIYSYDNNFGILTSSNSFDLHTSLSYLPNWGSGTSGKFELHSATTDLYLRVYNSNVGFEALLTIVVCLTN